MLGGAVACSLCPKDTQKRQGNNLLNPTVHLLYVAPGMIVHYIEDHAYNAPTEFVDAVMTCPRQGSAEFMELMRPFEQLLWL
jgi:hypothetical protein